MDKHDYLVDNEDSKSSVDNDHAGESTQMCSYQQDELTENCSYRQDDTRRGYSGNTTFRFIEILNFKHFARYFTFDPVDNLGRNKRLNDYLNVSVLLKVECGDMSETE